MHIQIPMKIQMYTFKICLLKIVIEKHYFQNSKYLCDGQLHKNRNCCNHWVAIIIFLSKKVPVLFLDGFQQLLFSYLPHQPFKDAARWKNTNIQLFSVRWFENLMFQQNLHAAPISQGAVQ